MRCPACHSNLTLPACTPAFASKAAMACKSDCSIWRPSLRVATNSFLKNPTVAPAVMATPPGFISYSDAHQIACGLLHTSYENLDQAICEHSFYYSRALARLHPILYGYDVVIVPGLSISRPQILTRQGLS